MPEVRDYSWGTFAEQKSENECYENLSNAVIQQAVADMADAVYRKELAERQIAESSKIFAECAKFFHERPGFDSWVGKIPWKRAWQPTPVFLPGESHFQMSREGSGTPLQYSCLENPTGGGAW